MAQPRNTPTERMCPECQGAGAIDVPHHNPQLDTIRDCPRVDCMGGWIRTAPVDPLELLKDARRDYRRRFPSPEYAGKRYGALRQRVVSPLNQPLPDSLPVLYRNVETAISDFRGEAERDARAALQNHEFVMGHFNRQLGIAA